MLSALDLSEDAPLRILFKGKALTADPFSLCESAGLKPGATIMLVHSKPTDIEAVKAAKPERMRGFEEGDLRQATGGLSGRVSGVRAASTSGGAISPYRFHALQPLRQLMPGATPPVSACGARLEQLAEDRGILRILEDHKWTIGKLSEMPPEGMVGVSESCLMGLNRNKGEEILLRLRTDDWSGLRPYLSVVDVLLHELAHCVHGDHDNNFKALWSLLKMEYAQHSSREKRGRSTVGSETYQPPASAFSTEENSHVLGGSRASTISPAEAAAAAATARAGIMSSHPRNEGFQQAQTVPVATECEDCPMDEE